MLRITITMIVSLATYYYGHSIDSTSVHFQLDGKLMIIEATVAGYSGYFILDTGIEKLVLNDRYYGGSPSGKAMFGLGQQPVSSSNKLVDVKIGEFTWSGENARILSLEHLEKIKQRPIHGLIGTELFRMYRFELALDFDAATMTIYKTSRKKPLRRNKINQPPSHSLNLTWKKGIPCIDGFLQNHDVSIGLDTGAEGNILNKKSLWKAGEHYRSDQARLLSGIHSKMHTVNAGQINGLSVEDHECVPIRVIPFALSHFNHPGRANYVDLIIGYDLLSDFYVVFNFRNHKVLLWDRSLEGSTTTGDIKNKTSVEAGFR